MTAWTVAIPGRLGRRRIRRVLPLLEGLGDPVTGLDRGDLGHVVGRALATGSDGVAIAGTDADLAALAGAVIARDAADRLRLGLVPVGERSSLMRMFGLPHRTGPAEHLRGHDEYRCDLIRLTTSSGARLVAGWAGLGSAASSRPGRLARRISPQEVTARTTNRTLVHTAYGALLANSQFWGNANPAPRATLIDGRFDLQLFLARRSRNLGSALEHGRHTGRPDVVRTSVADAVVTTERPWPVVADGEAAGETPVHAVALGGAIRLAI